MPDDSRQFDVIAPDDGHDLVALPAGAVVYLGSVTEGVFAAVLALITDGSSMRAACAEAGVTRQSFLRYVDAGGAERADQYARSLAAGCDALADDMLSIADDGSADWETRRDANGNEYQVVNNEAVQRSKLRADTRKWLLSKRLPKKYGDKLELAGDAANPLTVVVSATDAKL